VCDEQLLHDRIQAVDGTMRVKAGCRVSQDPAGDLLKKYDETAKVESPTSEALLRRLF
jgi:hypothetical protein